jgi:ABC-type transporter Mla MlaB component
MTFRITRLDDHRQTVLKVDGWLEAEGLPDLERELDRARRVSLAGLTLDLSGLRQADEAAVELLRRLAAGGARFINCPPYLALRLAPPGSRNGHEAP